MQIVREFDMPAVIEGDAESPPTQRGMAITTRAEALQLLIQLRADLPSSSAGQRRGRGGGRRDSHRWVPPDTVTFELYDGETWQRVEALDCGIPGVRVMDLPEFVGNGPTIVRLTTPDSGIVLVTGDVMWHDKKAGTAGLQFTFQNDEDREAWFEGLVEALLSRHAMN